MSAIQDAIIKLGPAEIHQALSIDLDRDTEQALSFIHEKIVEKLLDSSCLPLFNMTRGPWSCRPACNKPCCLKGQRLQAKSVMAP